MMKVHVEDPPDSSVQPIFWMRLFPHIGNRDVRFGPGRSKAKQFG